jgi:hypothetical protein
MKNINWKNIAVIALVSVVAVTIVWPRVRPIVARIPVIGSLV